MRFRIEGSATIALDRRLLRLTLAALAGTALATPARAQVAGGVVDLFKDHTFQTSNQPMWGSGQPPDIHVRFFDFFFDTGLKSGAAEFFLEDAELGDYGASIGGSARAAFGLSAGVDFTAGRVGVDYPVRLRLTYPEPNSFRDGEDIRILTGFARLPNGKITAGEPFASVDLTGKIGFFAEADMTLCVVFCSDSQALGPVAFPSTFKTNPVPMDVSVFRLDTDAHVVYPTNVVPFIVDEKPLPHTFSGVETVVTGLSGSVDLPHAAIPCPATAVGCTSSVVDQGATGLLGSVQHPFINISLDIDTWWSKLTKLPLGVTLPFDGFGAPAGSAAKADGVDIQVPLGITEKQDFEFTPDPRVVLTFPRTVVWRVTEGVGPAETQVDAGTGVAVPFEVGQTLYLTYPSGVKTPMVANSAFQLRNQFANRTRFEIDSKYTTTLGFLSLNIPSWEVFPELTVDACYETTVTLDPLDVWPDESCPVTTPAVVAPSVDETVGPWFSHPITVVDQSFAIPLAPWELAGFAALTGDSFSLDPENPSIAVSTSVVSGLATGTGPAGTLVQTLRVENTGDVKLLTSQVLDALSVSFNQLPGFTVNSVTSASLSPNGAFNGTSVDRTLVGQDVLGVGQTAFITVQTAVTPGNVYHSQVDANGMSPIGTPVTASASSSFAVYAANFDTDKLNGPGGPGARLPLHILNTPALDIHQIDPASLMIDGLAPLNWDYVLRDGRGPEVDLALQFDRGAIWARLQARIGTLVAGAAATAGEVRRAAALDVSALIGFVLGNRTPDAALAKNADLLGNANGRLDVGDLRAALLDGRPAPPNTVQAKPGNEVSVSLPLTGVMKDGTPFLAEDSIIIPQEG